MSLQVPPPDAADTDPDERFLHPRQNIVLHSLNC